MLLQGGDAWLLQERALMRLGCASVFAHVKHFDIIVNGMCVFETHGRYATSQKMVCPPRGHSPRTTQNGDRARGPYKYVFDCWTR